MVKDLLLSSLYQKQEHNIHSPLLLKIVLQVLAKAIIKEKNK